MNKKLRILIAEDSEDDAMLMVREIRRNGYEPKFKLVDNPGDMCAALDGQVWDVVLADHSMLHFSGEAALGLLKDRGIDLPFIIVSGKIGEETAVEMIKKGAHDFVMKDGLSRLVPAICRETKDAEIRKKRRIVVEELKVSEENYRSIFNLANDAIFIHDIENGGILDVNEKIYDMFGYSRDDALRLNVEDLSSGEPPYTHREALQWVKKAADGEPQIFEWRAKHRDGRLFWIEVNLKLIVLEGMKRVVAVVRDIENRKKMEEELKTLSMTDELTGLYNRRGFTSIAEQQLKIARRIKEKVLLLCADLDNLKKINDSLGHKQGDLALVETANILKKSFRSSDIIARVGGDEFVVLQFGNSDAIANLITSRLHQKLHINNTIMDDNFKLSMSVGIVHCEPGKTVSINELLDRADKIMYENKRTKYDY